MTFIGSNIKKIAAENGSKIAIKTRKKHLNYRELSNNIDLYKQYLVSLSDKKSAHVAIYIKDPITYLQTYLSILSVGWLAFPIHQGQTPSSIKQLFEVLAPDFIATDCAALFSDMKIPIIPSEPRLIVPQNELVDSLSPKGQDAFYIGQTSGSSGLPKLFSRTHASWLRSFTVMEDAFSMEKVKTICAPGPLTHSLSLCMASYTLHRGKTFYAMESFSASNLYDEIKKQTVDMIFVVPTMLHALTNMPTTSRPICFVSAGDALHNRLYEKIRQTYKNSTIFEYYGAAELSFITYKNETLHKQSPSVTGTTFQDVRITICNKNGQALPPNEIGSIYVNSPFIFDKYISRNSLDKNEYGITVGDLGYLNEDGNLTLVGRDHHRIISAGHNIFPAEIEDEILLEKDVENVLVTGHTHDRFGEIVVAYIQLRPNNHEALKRIKQRCRQSLSRWKRPRKYVLVDSFPLTYTGKIARKTFIESLQKEGIK